MKKATRSTPAKSVDDYLDALPDKVRATLQKLRKTIRSVAPRAEEVISYQIPIFKYNGMLVGFAAFKAHCSFFVMSKSTMKVFQEELKSYDTNPGTIRFSVDKPLPSGLVKKMVIARIKENEARQMVKEAKRTFSKKKK